MHLSLDRDAFIRLAATASVVPLSVELVADRLTPVSIFERLVSDGDGFLLESVEGGERWARWSFIGWHPAFTVTARNGQTDADAAWVEIPAGDPLTVLEALTDRFSTPPDDQLGFAGPVPPLHSGAVGFLAYDTVRYVESLPDRPPDDRNLPEMSWQFVGGVAAFDRLRDSVTLIWNAFIGEDPGADYDRAVAALEAAVSTVGAVGDADMTVRPNTAAPPVSASASMTQNEFEDAVRVAIDHIVAGDAFQIVPSIRLEADHGSDPFSIYRALRLVNPSPYMFIVRSGDLAIVGSSPELMARVRNGTAYSRPIAGTRPRGATDAQDQALERELLADPKERAEHVMLIDLARNDLGRVCEFGSVAVDDLMVIERYSHVMHIVSGVSGELRSGVGPVDVLRATFPHGTVSGAPKVRAMEIIDDLEPTARGPYAGAVGYIDFSGNLDTAIALRTCIIDGDRAWVQAGAGIVVDSDPAAEYAECMDKASAVLTAISIARSLEPGA